MYKIVGADGREYGPVSLDQLAEWVRQGRVTSRTLVQLGDGPWQPLGSYSEFATVLAETAGGSPAIPAEPTQPSPLAPSAGPAGSGSSASEPQTESAGYGGAASSAPTAYFMRGADGREYGPASFEQMRAWILENRAGPQTLARRSESADWQPLSTFQEFASFFPRAGAGAGSPIGKPEITADRSAPPAMHGHLLAEHIRGRDYRVQIGENFSRAWELFKANAGTIIAAEILLFILMMAGSMVSGLLTGFSGGNPPPGQIQKVQHLSLLGLGWVIQTCVNALAMAGFYALLLNLIRGHRVPVTNVFLGFSRLAGPLIALEFVRTVLVLLGVAMCILPGIYLGVAWLFAVPVLLDKRYSFWESMEVSRKVITHHWFQVFLFAILMGLFTVAGVLACIVGLLVTFPVGNLAFLYLYEDVFDIEKPAYAQG